MSVPLERRVADHLRRHALVPPAGRVLALVSGGPDSTCLMHVLAGLLPGRVGVLSVDHGLRPEAAGEADAVRAAAAALDLPAQVSRLGLTPGPGAPARARRARLEAARAAAERGGYARIATGHTASDQAETVLFQLARGSGRAGALGMAPRRGAFIRPLLGVSAAETRAWCRARGLATADDPGNRDARLARARVRHELLPALRAVHPGAERAVAALADTLRDEAELLAPLLDEAWSRCHEGPGLRRDRLGAEPPALRRLLIRRLLAEAGLPAAAREGEPVARALDLIEGAGGACDLPGGRVAVERGRLVAHRPAGPPAPEASLPVPGEARFAGAVVRARPGVAAPPTARRVAVEVAEGAPLVVRAPRPGDRLPLPGGGRQAVGRLLAAAGVPARLRGVVPVVATPERAVWVAGHRAAPDLLATPGARALVLELTGDAG